MDQSLKDDYIAQVQFLIAYYHYLMARCYGPIILVKEEPDLNTSPADYLGRSSYDECVQFICNLFDEAAGKLPVKRSTTREYGMATSLAAKSLKAKMLLYAASPLFNGGTDYYNNFTDKNGVQLIPTTPDPNKWVLARDAYKEAIEAAEAAGHQLYMNTEYLLGANKYPNEPVQRRLRFTIMEPGNPEIIWADTRNEDNNYGIQAKSLPHVDNVAWNGTSPTLEMLKRFYTTNGLPVDKDPNFAADNAWWNVVDVSATTTDTLYARGKTIEFNLNREPRYYAWVAFQGGYYEVLSAASNGAYDGDGSYKSYGPGRLVCNFLVEAGSNTSRGTNAGSMRTNDYSPSGFLNKKGVHPGYAVAKSGNSIMQYPWPIVRLADLYLGYAEACVETGDLETARIYLNKVRERAGIPTVEASWKLANVTIFTQTNLRDIVRQERMVELYLENQNFWDMRRWVLAEKYFEGQPQGMNSAGTLLTNDPLDNRYNRVTTAMGSGGQHHFISPTHYLLPIPVGDVNKNPNLVQNPGY
jgi:hypothetical protein